MSYRDPQVIDGSHVDQNKLIRLLEAVYGKDDEGNNKFRVEVRFCLWYYPSPNVLTAVVEAEPVQNLPEGWVCDST